jgi:hypothetical protein
MKKFGVNLELIGYKWLEVEADTTQEAREKALEIGMNLDLKEFNDATEVTVIDVVLDEAVV